jgi:hypothetical protein
LPIGRSQTCTKNSVIELSESYVLKLVVLDIVLRTVWFILNPDLADESISANLASINTSDHNNITNNTDIRQNVPPLEICSICVSGLSPPY